MWIHELLYCVLNLWQINLIWFDFYPRDAMLARYLLSLRVCPSQVRLVLTAKRRITQSTLHDSPRTRVLWYKISLRNPDGIILIGAPNVGGVKLRFSTGREVSGSDTLPPKIYVRPPRWSVYTKVRWRRNSRCYQQHWPQSKYVVILTTKSVNFWVVLYVDLGTLGIRHVRWK